MSAQNYYILLDRKHLSSPGHELWRICDVKCMGVRDFKDELSSLYQGAKLIGLTLHNGDIVVLKDTMSELLHLPGDLVSLDSWKSLVSYYRSAHGYQNGWVFNGSSLVPTQDGAGARPPITPDELRKKREMEFFATKSKSPSDYWTKYED